jgi:hypothetical protein
MKSKIATEYSTNALNGIGPLGNPSDPFDTFETVLSTAIAIITIIAGIWFLFLLITGGISWMSAGGDKVAAENARKRITTGLIGLVVVVAGIFIVDLVGTLIGVDILNVGDLLYSLAP